MDKLKDLHTNWNTFPKNIENFVSNEQQSDDEVVCVESEDEDISIVNEHPGYESGYSISVKQKVTTTEQEIQIVNYQSTGPPDPLQRDEKKTFLHLPLDKEYEYFSDKCGVARVKSRIVEKYNVVPKEGCQQRNMRLSIFFANVERLNYVNLVEKKVIEVATEAWYLKSLYPKTGVPKIAKKLVALISGEGFCIQQMIYVYLIHTLLSIERLFSKSSTGTNLYRNAFFKNRFCERFQNIVTQAPLEMKHELYALRRRWTEFFPLGVLLEIDRDNFWLSQGLQYQQTSQSVCTKTIQTTTTESQIIKRGVKRRCESVDNSVCKRQANVVDVMTLENSCEDDDEEDGDSDSSVEIVRDLHQKEVVKAFITLSDDEDDKSQTSVNQPRKPLVFNGKVYPGVFTSFVQVPTKLDTPSFSTFSTAVHSTEKSPCALPMYDDKTADRLQKILQRGKEFPIGRNDNTILPSQNAKQQMIVASVQQQNWEMKSVSESQANAKSQSVNKVGVERRPNETNFGQRKVGRLQKPKKVQQVQVENFMSPDFLDQFLSPTLANFEIVYGEDGKATTKFTHFT